MGIDAFVYRDAAGCPRLKPVVEINPRYTMGRVLLELMRYVVPGASGCFRLVNLAALRAAGFTDFASYAHHLRSKHPVELAGNPMRKILRGMVCLNDPARAVVALALLEVAGDQS